MKSCRVLFGSALVSSCFMIHDARAQVVTELSDGTSAHDPRIDALSDLIFDGGFDGQRNGGTSCGAATILGGGTTYTSDTTVAPNWMSSFGPLFSPSNDVVYMFVAGPEVDGTITPIASNYTFAMYLIPSCTDSGTEPPPIGASGTVGRGIDLAASGVISGNTYYLAITGTASGGPGANGTVNFTTPFSLTMAPRF